MANITRMTRRLIADQVAQNAARELSDCVRALDLAERKTAIGVKFHQRLARIVIGLERVRPDLHALRASAKNGDRQAAFLVEEYGVQCKERDRLIRKMATSATLADPRFNTLGPIKWASAVIRAAKTKRVATAKRRKIARSKRTVVTSGLKLIRRKAAGGSAVVTATASSTATDLDNEFFSLRALKQMARAFKGKLAFLNHRYSVPDDVFGTIIGTALVKRGGDDALDISIKVDESNPKAAATLEMIRGGTRLGVSVGVLVADGGSKEEADGRRSLNDIVALEASIVGIPSNQSAWTSGAKSRVRAHLTAALA